MRMNTTPVGLNSVGMHRAYQISRPQTGLPDPFLRAVAYIRSCRVIEQTSLKKSAHTVARGLSGGQKRRLKIALELLVDREIFFLGKVLLPSTPFSFDPWPRS